MPDHLPRRPTLPAPSAPPAELLNRARRGGMEAVGIGGECIVCSAEESHGWAEAALTGIGYRYGSTSSLVVGWLCHDPTCVEFAEGIAAASRREAHARPMSRLIER